MKLKIAIQKSGRLTDKSLAILRECGIRLENGKQKLLSPAINFPMEVYFLRDDDIPQYVEEGIVDLGIVGENVVLEKSKSVQIINRLGIAKCRMSLAIRRGEEYSGIEFFQGKKIATSYPNILSKYLQEQGITATLEEISGSVEIAPGIGLADGVCDLVSTGSTLLMNGLKEVDVVLKSEAVLIGNTNFPKYKNPLLDQLLFRLDAVSQAKDNKYILLNAPNGKIEEISNILPGMKSPTILPLAKEGWSSLHSVIREDDFWEIIHRLKEAGAEGILVAPIEKMIV